ncbi:MAG: hypothetical protein ACHRHE_19690 [Tepidisphaerales bacterium]
MSGPADPTWHREREKQIVEHVQKLLGDERLRIETTGGRKHAIMLGRDVMPSDREVDLKRMMMQKGIHDYAVQGRMPLGREVSVTLRKRRFFVFWSIVGDMKVVCISPWQDLLEGHEPRPADVSDVKAVLERLHKFHGVPQTVVLVSTSGFTESARDLAEQRGQQIAILAEPAASGGWRVKGPAGEEDLLGLIDPEEDDQKRQRVREQIDKAKVELLSGGVSAEKIAQRTDLPLRMVEDEVKSYAKEHGLSARKLDGALLLFREGSGLGSPARNGGSDMPFIERLKSLFSMKGETEKKITLLSERRAALSRQRDQSFEEMAALETQETQLKDEFKNTTSNLTKKRLTSQLLQLRKDLERRQQVLGMLNQQINVVSTHLHNLELVQQGSSAKLPDSEELAEDAAKAEEVMAELQASYEVAGSVAAAGPSGMSEEEQALFEELEKEMNPAKAETPAEKTPAQGAATKTPTEKAPVVAAEPPAVPGSAAKAKERQAEMG